MKCLEINKVTKRFGGLTAIKDLNLKIDESELRCIIGPNGAGKTTIFNLICGNLEPDDGQILFKGESLNGMSVAERSRLGIGRKFQSPAIFGCLTVRDNLEVAALGKASIRKITSPRTGKLQYQVEEVLEKIELKDKRDTVAQELSHGEKQWLEIGMVLTSSPLLLLLDEPTAGMTPAETYRTSKLIQRICEEIPAIVIEHDLKFVREIGTDITVLHRGSILAEGPIDEIAQDETVRQAYLGKKGL
ncbi:MAG: ATP-binding cassette domain-containing protein [Desulfobacterales bacterium]|nr:MAG: ATP-binding cassette domain-containing protein [Desulfobacterales bacterium]